MAAARRRADSRADGDRRVSRASLHARAAHDLREHRAPAQRASPRVRPRRRHARRAPLLVAAAGGRRRTAARCSTRRSSCAWSPTGRSACSCRAASTRGTIACRLAATGHAGLQSFSAAFPGSSFDESAEARGHRARRWACPTSASSCRRRSRDDFARIVAALDEPFADPSSFPTWYLARATERAREGGAGRRRRRRAVRRLQARSRKHLRNAWRGGFALPLPTAARRAAQGLAQGCWASWRSTGKSAYALRFSGLDAQPAALPAAGDARAAARTTGARPISPLDTRHDRLLRWDFANYLPEYVLRKADLCTMAHGLELRAPLLDHRFVEAVLALPPAQRFTDAAEAVPRARWPRNCERLGAFTRKKRGFNPPLRRLARRTISRRGCPPLAASLEHLTGGQLDARAHAGDGGRVSAHAGAWPSRCCRW